MEINNNNNNINFLTKVQTFNQMNTLEPNVLNNNFLKETNLTYQNVDLLNKNNIIIKSTTNNQITIIKNIIKKFSKKKNSSQNLKKSNLRKMTPHQSHKNVKFSKEVSDSPSSMICDLDIKKIAENKVNNPKRNRSLFLNEKFAKINIEYFNEINKRRSADLIGNKISNDDINTLNMASFSNDNNSKTTSNNNITSSNDINEIKNLKEIKIQNELKEDFKNNGEKIMRIKNFGIFKGFSAISFKNGEEFNEDKLGISLNVPTMHFHRKFNTNFFAIYDGHNGNQISSYLKENFHKILFKNKNLFSETDETIYKTFENIENTLMEQKINNEIEDCGSSALILINIEKNIYVSNLGNSRAIISIDNCYEVSQLSKEHIIDNLSEKERVENFGGKIIEDNNVKKIIPGNLSLTRSIGDYKSKLRIYNGIPNMISSVPDIVKVKNSENIDFIFLTSNGLIEYMNNFEICNIIYKTLKEGILSDFSFEKTIENINDNIINSAIERGSKKNLSFIFLPLNNLYKDFKENRIHNVNEALARLKILMNEPDIMSRSPYIKTMDISLLKQFPFSSMINKFFSPPLSSPDPNIFVKCIEDKNNISNNNKINESKEKMNLNNIHDLKNKKTKKKSIWSFFCFINCGVD